MGQAAHYEGRGNTQKEFWQDKTILDGSLPKLCQ